ncbi:uncharacterized protein LOC133175695 [Saccostrea echinata]|uniref:uncharacterized protein LOC133175695 n=1 Tax=Saccostrea echinata TaxID=191078 RepID=UPI002A81A7C6|nr:uncharacterized protein LOC133175695 [Saccostrea echinata]
MAEGPDDFDRKNPIGIFQDIEHEIKCCSCDKHFVYPVYLPCGHTICKSCVKRQRPVGKCSICKEMFNVKAHTFPRNPLFERLASIVRCRKYLDKLKRNPYCNFDDDHVENVSALMYCANCKLRLCQTCKHLHDKVPEARKHEVYLSGINFEESEYFSKISKCEFHIGYEITKWCSDCRLTACSECCPCDHQLIDISKAARSAEREIKQMQTRYKEAMSIVKTQQENVKGHEKTLGWILRYNVIKSSIGDVHNQTFYLLYEINLLLLFGGDADKLIALPCLLKQQYFIQKTTKNIQTRPVSDLSSNDRSSLTDSDSSRSPSLEIRDSPERKETSNIYYNEEDYADTSVYMRNPTNKDTKEITKKICQFDTESRITGMIVLGDIIVIASQSAGECTGYGTQGDRMWRISEKLDGPFDLDSYQANNDKQLLFISDPGKREESASAVRVYKQGKNNRYTYLTCFTKECIRPKGISAFAGRVYLCEPQRKEVTEYQICDNFTGKIVKRYNEEGMLKEPMYITAQVVNDRLFLLVSDKHMGLKRLLKGEEGNTHSGWSVTKEKIFTPSKCFVNESTSNKEVIVGNTTGRKLHLINFEPRQISHKDYNLDDSCSGPVAVLMNEQGQVVVGCKDGTVTIFEVVEVKEMRSINSTAADDGENIYELG